MKSLSGLLRAIIIKRLPGISLAIYFALCCLAPACKKDIAGIVPPQSYQADDFNQVFEAFWSGMNTNYVFWSLDTTRWDKIYADYQPLFAKLDIRNPDDIKTSIGYFTEMTRGLVDNHYTLSFNSSVSVVQISPALERKPHILPALPFRYFASTITKKYFDSADYYIAYDSFQTKMAGRVDSIWTGMVIGRINQHILYLHLNNFYLKYAVQTKKFRDFIDVWNRYVAGLRNPDLATKGLIVDMRSNSGGMIEDLNFLVGQMITSPLHWASTREKSGNGRLDYTPWADAIVTPQSGSVKITAPIVVLTDQRSKSMAEMTTMALKTMSNTFIIGDTTYGANGPLDTNLGLYGGGQFSFANFGYVFTSSAMLRYRDGKIYESKGFPPDQYVPVNRDSVIAGSDPMLEAAIKYLNK